MIDNPSRAIQQIVSTKVLFPALPPEDGAFELVEPYMVVPTLGLFRFLDVCLTTTPNWSNDDKVND